MAGARLSRVGLRGVGGGGKGFAAGFGDSAFFAGATFFAPGDFEVLETGFFFAGAALEGLTAGFAFPLGEADFGVVFFTAMAQE